MLFFLFPYVVLVEATKKPKMTKTHNRIGLKRSYFSAKRTKLTPIQNSQEMHVI